MKANATIAIYTLLLCFVSLTVASTRLLQKQMKTKPIYEPPQNISCKIQKLFKNISKRYKKFSFFQYVNLSKETNLFDIIVSYLMVEDVVHFRGTSRNFEILLYPNDAMLTRFYDQEERKIKTLPLNWFDLKFFLEEDHLSLAKMEIFKVQKDQYAAILEKGEKIITFHHGKKSFIHVLFEEATQFPDGEFMMKRPNHRFTGNQKMFEVELNGVYYRGKRRENEALIILKNGRAKIGLWPNGEVETWGNKFHGGGIETENVKMIFSCEDKFGVLTTMNGFYQWPTDWTNLAPSFRSNIKLVAPNHDTFLMLSNDGKICTLGGGWGTTEIPEKILPQLKNIKMIFSNYFDFMVLLKNGDIFRWGFNHDSDKLLVKNVKTIVSTDNSFAALTHNGDIYTYYLFEEEFIAKNAQEIYSNQYAFCALVTENRILIAWGGVKYGGYVPEVLADEDNIQTVYSTRTGFVAVLHDGRYWAWGVKSEFLGLYGARRYSYELTEISKYLQRNKKSF